MDQSSLGALEAAATEAAALASLKQINAELEQQNRQLRELAERRSAALSHLAHELRTPLTSILGFAEILLSQEKLTDAQRNFCQRIQSSAHQLQNTLSAMTELSRAEVLSTEKSPCD
ncbi:MAG TPA: histidine kinase dimerization/phospho-acceptor domain-containing protein [Pyrinomonadaceae bacterium]|nr:histidine kinase dimerization/phospho-acceptor domain-containing protein [Pyrinomonadaceae bacterium]